MKKLTLLLIITIGFVACKTQYYSLQTTGIDLQQYEKEGFRVSITGLEIPYESIAIVYSDCIPGVDANIKKQKPDFTNPVYETPEINNNYRHCYSEDLLDDMVRQSKQVGANALINLKFETAYLDDIQIYSATAMAVRIE